MNEPHRSRAELNATLRRGVRTPLRALRAALEELASRDGGDPRALAHATDLLAGVEREVETLEDWLVPAEAYAERCTAREVALAARSLLGEDAERVTVACEGPAHVLRTDAPLLARSLARLLRAVLESGGAALLRVRSTDEACRLSIVGAREERPGSGARSRRPGLGTTTAVRDLARLGFDPEFRLGADGIAAVGVVVRETPMEKEAA